MAPLLLGRCGAHADTLEGPASDPLSGRDAFLTAVIAVMMLLALASFLLFGRASERTHVALAMLTVLVGGFGLFVLFGSSLYENPLGAAVMLLLLIAIFKLMSQIENYRRPPKKD